VKLTSDFPFWLLRNGLTRTYPSLDRGMNCEVVIVGAGITGAILFDSLTAAGLQVVMVDRRDICTGSTAASTALLQYEIDVSLTEMQSLIGEERAGRAYRLSHESVDKLECLAESLDVDVGFARRTSIYFADSRPKALELAQEARARKALGLDITYHDKESTKATFGLDGEAALSSRQAASCDPYRLSHALIHRSVQRGGQVFDRTEIVKRSNVGNESELTTRTGFTIRAKYIVYANGYESQSMLNERIVNLDNTYALVSEPLQDAAPWDSDWLLWEAKEPYLYLRITDDNRLLVGGEDDEYHSPTRRDRSIDKKAEKIERKVRGLIPDLRWKVDYSWAGTFGKTKDGLAYIGRTEELPNSLLALCFGGNGITFSAIASTLVLDLIRQGHSPDADLFAFGR
jgi:glycine/D-amino acid oxidase-like deaminating enzyme